MKGLDTLTGATREDTNFFHTGEVYSARQRSSNRDIATLADALATARTALLSLQKEDGHWCFPLEADCTIPAEYVLMMWNP